MSGWGRSVTASPPHAERSARPRLWRASGHARLPDKRARCAELSWASSTKSVCRRQACRGHTLWRHQHLKQQHLLRTTRTSTSERTFLAFASFMARTQPAPSGDGMSLNPRSLEALHRVAQSGHVRPGLLCKRAAVVHPNPTTNSVNSSRPALGNPQPSASKQC
jgi:hypothetical protein